MTNTAIFDRKMEKMDCNTYTGYCFWGGLAPDNFDELEDPHGEGYVAFRSFIGSVSPDCSSLNYEQTCEAMEEIKEFGGYAGFHCEDFSVIKWQEAEMGRKGHMDW